MRLQDARTPFGLASLVAVGQYPLWQLLAPDTYRQKGDALTEPAAECSGTLAGEVVPPPGRRGRAVALLALPAGTWARGHVGTCDATRVEAQRH